MSNIKMYDYGEKTTCTLAEAKNKIGDKSFHSSNLHGIKFGNVYLVLSYDTIIAIHYNGLLYLAKENVSKQTARHKNIVLQSFKNNIVAEKTLDELKSVLCEITL